MNGPEQKLGAVRASGGGCGYKGVLYANMFSLRGLRDSLFAFCEQLVDFVSEQAFELVDVDFDPLFQLGDVSDLAHVGDL